MVSGKNSGGEKWGKSCTHSVRHAHDNTSHHWPYHRMKERIFIAITMFSRGLGALREQRPPLREDSGERGGEPRGARWGAGWETPGSKVGSKVEEHRATHTTPQSRESQVDPMERLSPYSPQSHATYQSGAPRSPGAPHFVSCVRTTSVVILSIIPASFLILDEGIPATAVVLLVGGGLVGDVSLTSGP